jgi:hypothetical protein
MKTIIAKSIFSAILLGSIVFAQEAPKPQEAQKPAAPTAPAASQDRTVRADGGGGMRMQGPRMMGTITEVKENSIAVKDQVGKIFTITTSGETRVRNGASEGTLKDIKVGANVMVMMTQTEGGATPAARNIVLMPAGQSTPQGNQQSSVQPGAQVSGQVQNSGPRGGGMRMQGGGPRVMGTVTEVKGNTVTVKDQQGKLTTVTTNSVTLVRNGMEEGSLKDVKVGTNVMIMGQSENEGPMAARMIAVMSAEQFQMVQQMMAQAGAQGGGQGNGQVMMGGNMQDQLGKTLVVGEIKAIDEVKITVLMPGDKTITFEVDENTSFKKGKESITLADFKVGDRIIAQGALNKAGTFVAKEMSNGGMMQFRRPTPPAADKPKQ